MIDKNSYIFINVVIFCIILLLFALKNKIWISLSSRIFFLLLNMTLIVNLLSFFILDVLGKPIGNLVKTKHRPELVITGHILIICLSILLLYWQFFSFDPQNYEFHRTETDVVLENPFDKSTEASDSGKARISGEADELEAADELKVADELEAAEKLKAAEKSKKAKKSSKKQKVKTMNLSKSIKYLENYILSKIATMIRENPAYENSVLTNSGIWHIIVAHIYEEIDENNLQPLLREVTQKGDIQDQDVQYYYEEGKRRIDEYFWKKYDQLLS